MSKVLFAELKKLFRLQHLLLIFLIALSARAVFCLLPTAHDHPYSDEVYKSCTALLEGRLTAEKTEYLNYAFG